MDSLTWLEHQGLLHPSVGAEPFAPAPTLQALLPRLCHAGRLLGGLSAASDLRPDELIGPLASAIGGTGAALKVLDVREAPVSELWVMPRRGVEVRWAVPDLRALVDHLNDATRGDATARRVAVLGEWESALQLWCLSRQSLATLVRRRDFTPENAAAL
ncbi:MAG TPA: hypothetical protein VEY30_06830 [Myxococcaceae bacterium]|nr:hypothetical protein [Myxococcaceae bacterium]